MDTRDKPISPSEFLKRGTALRQRQLDLEYQIKERAALHRGPEDKVLIDLQKRHKQVSEALEALLMRFRAGR